jgi:branched-chain amino acid transport system substrate-binding protein
MRANALLAGVWAVALSFAIAACSGSSAQPFKIGVLADCDGALFPYEPVVASTEAPLLERGAKPLGKSPSDGVGDVRVAGRPVELLQGCVSGDPDVIPEARRLVEEDGADAIVGTLYPQEGLVLEKYAPRRPDQVFLIQPSDAPELTLHRPPPNVFRFAPDASQTVAGLGTYAYKVLGWRKAIAVADENPYGFARIGGFVAEFCALGGTVERRWAPFFGDTTGLAAGVGTSADGVFFGASLASAGGLLNRLTSLHQDVSRTVVAGEDVLDFGPLGPLADGVVVAGNLPARPNPTERNLVSLLGKAFPRQALQPTDFVFRDGVEAVLDGLEHAHGDTRALPAALRSLVLASPSGSIHLDDDHQAVVPAYLSRVVIRGGKAQLRPLSVTTIGQRFHGYFGDPTLPFTKTTPACVRQEATP